jgi:light-independent protochlorophyllide reductase subunit B
MGIEGANVLFDTWVHPLMMGLEEHLLGMFKGDFEFHDDSAPSHLGTAPAVSATDRQTTEMRLMSGEVIWASEATAELRKIPFFVRGKAQRNTEKFAAERGIRTITIETLYDAKAHFAR